MPVALLNSYQAVKEILNSRNEVNNELHDAIFELYSANNRLSDLLKEAFKDHIQSLDKPSSFLENGSALRFLTLALFEDEIGRRYSVRLLEPLLLNLGNEDIPFEKTLDDYFFQLMSFTSTCPM